MMNIAQPAARTNFKALLLPIILAIGSLAAALIISFEPPVSGPIAAVFPPWWSAARSLIAASAAGSIVRFGAPFVVIIRPDIGDPGKVLRREGAWLVVNPQWAGGCGATPRSNGDQL